MEECKGNGKRGNLIAKTWERCKTTLGRNHHRKEYSPLSSTTRNKSKSVPRMDEFPRTAAIYGGKRRVVPQGCFSVYVGPKMRRFVIKTDYANHPLFKMLLEEAESEYGFNSGGPLALPCNVDVFCKVLMAIDDDKDGGHGPIRAGCGFLSSSKGYRLLTPPKMMMIAINQL